MPVESATYINDLDTANPLAGDLVSEGDNHLRLLKSALKTTFPSFTRPFYHDVATSTAGNVTVTTTMDRSFQSVDATASARTVTLPDTPATGFEVTVAKSDSSGNAVTVTRAGTNTINGLTTYALTTQYQNVKFKHVGSGVWLAVGIGGIEGSGGIGTNLAINGDFQLNQRVFAGGALAAGAFGFDRWKADTGGANMTLSGYVVTLVSGTIAQVIEKALWGVASFASTQFTVSVDTPADGLTITLGTATATIAAGSGRQSVTITTNPGDTGDIPVKIAKNSGVGSTNFGRVKVEVGSSATPWIARDTATELMLCQRYFSKGFAYADPVANNNAPGQSGRIYAAFAYLTTNLSSERIFFPATMRAIPTITLYHPNEAFYGTPAVAGRWSHYNGSAWVPSNSTSLGGVDSESFYLGFAAGTTMPSAGFGTFARGGWAANAEL